MPKLPPREELLAEIRAAESRAAAIQEIATKYGVYAGTVRRHIRGVQGQGSMNLDANFAPSVRDLESDQAEEAIQPAPLAGDAIVESAYDILGDSDQQDADEQGEEDSDAADVIEPADLSAEELAEDEEWLRENAGKWIEGERYVYNGDLDTYTFFLRTSARKQVLPGSTLRSMKRAYSDMGEGATINEVARTFKIRRDHFIEIKQIMGWTHDSDAFTDEEHLTRPTSDLLEDAVQLRRSKLDQEYNRKNWRDTQRDADRYRQLEHFIVQPLLESLPAIATRFSPPPMYFPAPRTRFAAITSSGELHYNKHGWVGETGESYDRAEADRRFAVTTEAMLGQIQSHGRPERLIYIVGNDDLHIDGLEYKTTGGTPQDVNGTGRQMLEEFYEIQVREIERLRSLAPVEILLSAGNHNTFLSYVIMKMLAIQYRSTQHVDVKLTARMRSYTQYGNTLIGVTHGHRVKPVNLMATMGVEAREYFSATRYKAWFTGHYHSEEVQNLVGGSRYQMPSLSGPDRWHVESGYFGQAGLTGYICDHEYGMVGSILCPVVTGMPDPIIPPASEWRVSA